MMRSGFLAALALVSAGAAGLPSPVKVPRGPAPAIDGRIDSTEWRGSAVEQLANGLTVRLRHDGQHLFIGVSSTEEGFPSVCAVKGDTIRILHASAALGAVSYGRAAGQQGSEAIWSSGDTAFVYGMRNVALNEQAAGERREYLAEHRWVASTFRMGQGRAHEVQMSLALLDGAPRIALGYHRNQGAQVAWPESLVSAGEGCAELELVRGYATAHPRFRPETYVELELQQ
jgi:hypothetical protein